MVLTLLALRKGPKEEGRTAELVSERSAREAKTVFLNCILVVVVMLMVAIGEKGRLL